MAAHDEGSITLDLIIALLAVNRWTLDRAFDIAEGLKRAGLTDATKLAAMPESEIAVRLGEAGYKRGSFMESLLARRIRRASDVLVNGGLRRIADLERAGDAKGIREFLLTLEGVGPEVAKNFIALRS